MAVWSDCYNTVTVGGKNVAEGVGTIKCLEPLFANIVRGVMALSGVALLVMLLIGGFNFLFSGGDPKKLESARGTIGSAFIGLIVILMAYVILNAIGVFTGVTDVTKFQITVPDALKAVPK
jgi:hypothetical protein